MKPIMAEACSLFHNIMMGFQRVHIDSLQQGQGGWVGYGSVVVTVSDATVDADGYVKVYIPIIWEE